jgi:tRNA (cytidine32/uridine32-2'-O)-methyltransferase
MTEIFNNIRIILVNTTEAGNIGAVARAMKNMCLSDLYLVNPKNFPSSVATARASSADDILETATVVDNLSDALDGVSLIIGASARQRERKVPQLDVVKSCEKAKNIAKSGEKVAIMFGTERSGLTNTELDFAHILMTIPGNPNYFSLNLAQAVQVFAYQNFITMTAENEAVEKVETIKENENLANFNEVEGFYSHLFQILEHIDYIDKKRPLELTSRRIKRIFSKAELQKDEVAILRGILRNIKEYE